jgi:hypothetical protein
VSAECVCCGKPMPDQAYACHRCAQGLAQALNTVAGHAEDAWTVIARQARYGGAGGARKIEPEPVETAADARRNAVTEFAWAASIERPARGALRAEPMPPDLSASDRLATVANVVTTWARHVCELRGVELPARRPLLGPLCHGGTEGCLHRSCADIRHRRPPSALGEAAAWLAGQVDWLRKRPEAGEAVDELLDACAILARLVDSPASAVLVGVCDCGTTLYAPPWRSVVECPDKRCKLRWDVEKSRDILRDALREKLFTAAEAAHLAAYWDERTSEQIRKLISMWVRPERRLIEAHGRLGEDPLYRFGDVIDRLARTPTRRRAEAVA